MRNLLLWFILTLFYNKSRNSSLQIPYLIHIKNVLLMITCIQYINIHAWIICWWFLIYMYHKSWLIGSMFLTFINMKKMSFAVCLCLWLFHPIQWCCFGIPTSKTTLIYIQTNAKGWLNYMKELSISFGIA